MSDVICDDSGRSTGSTAEQVQVAFLAFHAGDVDCGLDWSAAPVVAEPKQKRGLFRRG